MKDILPIGLKLFLICAVAAVTLGGVNVVTAPIIAERKVQEMRQALEELTPHAQLGEVVPVEGNPVVSARYDVLEGGKPVGMLLQLTGSGYGGDLKILARYQLDGAIVAVELLEDSETPGLGKKAESPSYMEKFVGTGSPEKPVPVRKDMLSAQQADAVTGATITFMGISKALADGAAYVRQTAGTQKE